MSSLQFIGGDRKELVGFKIGVRNKKEQEVEIIIEDQVPVPTNKEIEVDLLESDMAEYKKETGNLKWALKLSPGENRELDLRYEVKYPKYQELILE